MRKISKYKIEIWLLFTLLLSAVTAFGYQISFVGSVWGTPQENYIRPLGSKTIFYFMASFLCINGIAAIVWAIHQRYQVMSEKTREKRAMETSEFGRMYGICVLVLFFTWLPYYLTYFPGGVYSDTFGNIKQAYAMDELGMYALTNHHPILYTLLWRAAILLSRLFHLSTKSAIIIFFSAQFMLMIVIMAYLICWLSAHGLCKAISYGMLAFVALFPLFPLYAISLWKDTPFSLILLLFVLHIGEYALSEEKDCLLNSSRYIIKMMTLGLLVCFLRNNGKYIVFFMLLMIAILNLKRICERKKYLLAAGALILIVQGIQGPVYDALGYNVDSTTESLGVPMQQIAYLIYYEYDLSEEEMAYFDQICPIEQIKEHYNPCLFDAIKWYAPDYDISVVEKDMGTFFAHYLKLLIKHPVGCIKGYLLATAGFWAPNIASRDAYVQDYVWSNSYGIEDYDVLETCFGVSMKTFLSNIPPISSAVFLFIMCFAAFVVVLSKEYRKLLILLPGAINWGTIMLATPIACSLRYVYILVLMVPVDIYLICISGRRENA